MFFVIKHLTITDNKSFGRQLSCFIVLRRHIYSLSSYIYILCRCIKNVYYARNIALFQEDFVSIIQYNILNILLLNIKHSKFALEHLNFYAMKHSNYVIIYIYIHTFAAITHSNRSSVLLLSEWTPYPNDSDSKKNNIVNHSNKILTTEQTIILNKGQSFCPS